MSSQPDSTESSSSEMVRHAFTHAGLTFSYLDPGGQGRLIVALHATWMEAGTYENFARAMSPAWRVVALDQRGHGHSAHASDYSWDAWVSDLEALLEALGVEGPVILAGNSLGGMVAFKFAARHPDRVAAMVIEEAPVEYQGDLEFIRDWEGVYPTRDALAEKIGPRLAWSVEPSFRRTDSGWTLAFSPTELADAQAGLKGDFWDEWLASACPALVVRGAQSRAVDGTLLEKMAATRPNTDIVRFDAGHVVHHDKAAAFTHAVDAFLNRSISRDS